jgi:hypothetical protein
VNFLSERQTDSEQEEFESSSLYAKEKQEGHIQALNDSLRELFVVSEQAQMLKRQTAIYRKSYSKKLRVKYFSFLQKGYLLLAACLLFLPPVFAQQKPIVPNSPSTSKPQSKDIVQQQLPPAGQVSTAASFNAGASRSGYVLGPGDQFKLTVFDYEEFTGPQVILTRW